MHPPVSAGDEETFLLRFRLVLGSVKPQRMDHSREEDVLHVNGSMQEGEPTSNGLRILPGMTPGRSETRSADRFPPEMLRGLNQGRGVLFVGPAISRLAGIPFRSLLHDALANSLRDAVSFQEQEGLEAFLAQAGTAERAQALHDQLGDEGYRLHLQRLLPLEDLPASPLVYALRGLGFKRLVTTNPDRLLERAYENPLDDSLELEVMTVTPETGDPLPAPTGRPVLLKLFGDLRRPETLVTTTDDLEAYWRLRPGLVQRLKSLLEVGPALFVGFSLHDPEFRRLYAQVGALLSRAHRRAYAILEEPSRFEAHWWQQRSLHLIPVTPQEQLEEVVRELTRQMTSTRLSSVELETEPATSSRAGLSATWPLALPLRAHLQQQQQNWTLRRVPSPGQPPNEALTPIIPIHLWQPPRSEDQPPLEQLLHDQDVKHATRLHAPPVTSLHAAFEQHRRLVVLGPAGSGKTTLMLQLFKALGEASLEANDRKLVLYLPLTAASYAPSKTLFECAVEQLRPLTPRESWEDVEQAANDAFHAGQVVLLFDGLDEIPWDAQVSVGARLNLLMRESPRCSFVLSCRKGAWHPDIAVFTKSLPTFELAPFTAEQASLFVRGQCAGDERAAETLVAFLRMQSVNGLQRLVFHPLHLLLLCHRYRLRGQVDERRLPLYEDYLSGLLRLDVNGIENQIYASDKELILQRLALQLMKEPLRPLSQELALDLIDKVISEAHIVPMTDADRRVETLVVLDELVRSSVLTPTGSGRTFLFRHSAFKEYLVCRAMFAQSDRETLIRQHARDPYWAGVWRLLTALEKDATALLTLLDQSQPQQEKLVESCFGEARRVQSTWFAARLRDDKPERIAALLQRLKDQLKPQDALDLFGELLWRDRELYLQTGDRLDTRLLYHALRSLQRMVAEQGPLAHRATEQLLTWKAPPDGSADTDGSGRLVTVPGGAFLVGEAPGRLRRLHNLPTFELAVEPMSLARFRNFFPNHQLPPVNGYTAFLTVDHPVVGVSWFDAWVCAAWYGGRLPSELEWEKAASWDAEHQTARIWPWGNEWNAENCNNLHWSGFDACTTNPRLFERVGASPVGCLDMAGNVLEWTQDTPVGLQSSRVLKGGAWGAAPHFVKCSASVWIKPEYRGLSVGFRLARTPAKLHLTPST